jgi:uncharacterized protein
MKMLHMVAFALVVVGGLNWLLVGAIGWDIGELLGGQDNIVPRIIYILVGLSAVYLVVTHKGDCKSCSAGGGSSAGSSPMGGGSKPVA